MYLSCARQLALIMKQLLFSLMLLLCTLFTRAQQLSPAAQISIITCGPYQGELYSAFGHSAIRVFDPTNGINDAYNYGVFDFDQPNFYLNFARGYLYYQLGVYDYDLFRDYYIYHNRYIHEQVLNLTAAQKEKIYQYLVTNAQPENKVYRYDYFYNNCATKVRDVFATVFGEQVTFDGSYVTTRYTIRDLTDLYLKQQPWGDLGIDICLGLPIDKMASPYEYMFLPDYIESGFEHATILQDSGTVKLVKETRHVYDAIEEAPPAGLPHPLLLLSAITILAAALTLWDFRRKKISMWFDVILFGTAGALGLLLLVLWVGTDHAAAARNFNLLWALPLHLVAVIAFVKQPTWLKNYFLATAVILVLLIITWQVLPQRINYALIPVIAALLLRSFTQYRLRQQAGL